MTTEMPPAHDGRRASADAERIVGIHTGASDQNADSTNGWIIAGAALVMASLFAAGLAAGSGHIFAYLYVFPLWMISTWGHGRVLLLAAAGAGLLVIVEYVLSAAPAGITGLLAERGGALLLIAIATIVLRELHSAGLEGQDEAARELARFVEQTGDALISVDLEGTIRSWNLGAERIYGFTAEEMLGTNISRLTLPDSKDGLSAVLGEVLQGKVLDHWPAVRRHKDGHSIEVELTVSQLLDEGGRTVGIAAVSRDVSARNKSQREAETLRAWLERSNEALKRSNEDLKQFVSIASHDLRAPMRGIRALVSFISEDQANRISDESTGYMADLEVRVARLQGILDGLLQYARAGRGRADIGMVDTGELCRTMDEYLTFPEGFELVVADSMPSIETSKVALATVLRNLVGNAIRHHDRPEGRIEVLAKDAGDEVVFSVSDDGPGIDPIFHSRIFEAFKTLGPSADGMETGMGLAIVRRVVRLAGGKVWVESAEDRRGTTFHFTWQKAWPEDVEGELGEDTDLPA